MAYIAQMKISGVRSVGVGEDNAHIIKFLKPLTIISGPNGAGKTTIIECLNYVTTGTLPTGNLPTFIHNVKLADKTRVDSMVKLQFFDSKNRECVATKRMTSALSKGDKIKSESEEFTIQIRKNESVVKISSKVADFRREMLNLLGIPTAILESVVFCHQEDSCWPLSEPKELKKRFDRIFQLTKFVKAGEQMKKISKEYANELKVLTEKKKNGEMLLMNKAKYVLDLKSTEKIHSEATEKLYKLGSKIQECTNFMKSASEKLVHFERLQRTLDLKKAELKGKHDHLNNLSSPPFKGSIEMLQAEIDQLSSLAEFQNLVNKKVFLEEEINRIREQIDDLKLLQKKKNDEMVNFKGEEMLRSNLLSALGELEQKLSSKYGMRAGVEFDSDFSDLVKTEEIKLARINSEVSDQRQQYDQAVSSADSKYNSLKFEQSALRSHLTKLEHEIAVSEQRLKSAASSQSAISALNAEIKELEEDISTLPTSNDEEANKLREERERQQNILADLRLRLKNSEVFEEAEKEIERKREEYEIVCASLEAMKEKHRESFVSLFDGFQNGPWSEAITSARQEHVTKLSSAESLLNKSMLIAEREKQNVIVIERSQDRLRSELSELQSKILNTSGCLPSDVTTQLDDVKTKLKRVRKELAPLDTKAILYGNWSNDVLEKSCCPLCDRKFTGKNGAHDLSKKLMDMSIRFPEEISKLRNEVTVYEEREDMLSSASADVERIRKIDLELAELSSRRSQSEQLLKTESSRVDTCRFGVAAIKDQLKKLDLIQMDVGLMDNYLSSSLRIERELSDLNKLVSSSNVQPCRALRETIDKQEKSINQLLIQCDQLQLQAHKKNYLCEKLNSLRDHRISLGEAAAQSSMIHEQLEVKKREKMELMQKQISINKELPLVEDNLQFARKQLSDFLGQTAEKERIQNQRVQAMSVEKSRLDDLVERLTKISENKKQSEDCAEMLKSTEDQILQKSMMINRLENQSGDLDNMTVKKRTLEDQKTRMMLENHISELVNEINDLELEVEDPDAIRNRLNEASSERSKAEVERGRIEGQLAGTEKTRREAEQALKAKNMSDAEKVYRDIVVDKLVLEKAIEDLEKYSKSLDKSILQFHTEKMIAINEILDRLWRRVYRGDDIESIKIRSDMAATTDKRKSYDYKVVMLVDRGKEIEMRNRCSAGQKMLACILIRIALADVFGGVCSMIALDEPTTNLDVEKVEYLAGMLNELIAAKRNEDVYGRGKQFQMIVITHDQRLVETLTLGTRPDFYYILKKNPLGISTIRRAYPNGDERPNSTQEFPAPDV